MNCTCNQPNAVLGSQCPKCGKTVAAVAAQPPSQAVLLACPFCGGCEVESTYWRSKVMIACNNCGAAGPWAGRWDEDTKGKEVELWNQRIPAP